MSLIKKEFQTACNYFLDYTDVLLEYVALRDLSTIIQGYTFSEMDFETTLYRQAYRYVVSHNYKAFHRLVWIVYNCPLQPVKQWRDQVIKLVHHYKSLSKFAVTDPYSCLSDSLNMFQTTTVSPQRCNRVWCWYQKDDCFCGQTLNVPFFQQQDTL